MKETRTLACGKCKVAWFCSKECQTTAWKAKHKQECKSTLLYNLKAYPPDLLRKAPLEVIDKWVTHLASLSPSYSTSPIDVVHRRAALQMLLACLVILPQDAPGRLGLMPGFARILQEEGIRGGGGESKQKSSSSSSSSSSSDGGKEEEDGKEEDVCMLVLNILAVCLGQGKLNASLFYLCGGTRALADLVFLHPSSSSSSSSSDGWTPVGKRQGLALSALVHALMEPNDFVLVSTILGFYPATDVLVPVLLHLMDPRVEKEEEEEGREEMWKARLRQHQEAGNLMTLCINLQTEVPVEMWQEGFRVLKELTQYYLEPRSNKSSSSSNSSSSSSKKSLGERIMEDARLSLSPPPSSSSSSSSTTTTQAEDESSSSAQGLSVHLRWLLLDLSALISGYVDHFPQAVHLVLPLGLPTLLGLLLSFSSDESVQQTASLITRHCLKGTGFLDDFNLIVGANESKVLMEAVHTTERAVAALLEMEGQLRVQQERKRKQKGGKKEEEEKVSDEEEEKDKEIQLALLKGGLSLSAECLKADSALLEAYLPNLFLVLRLVLTNCCCSEEEEEGGKEGEDDKPSHMLSPALNEALACVLNSLLYLPPKLLSPLLGNSAADDDSSSSSSSGQQHLLTSLRYLLKKHMHDPPPSLASMICNIYALLAGSSSSRTESEEEDDENNSVPALLARLLLDGENVQDPALIKGALFALQEYVWASPQVVLSQLRSPPDAAVLQERLEDLVASGAVECEYLACVLKGGKGGEEEDETLLSITPIKTADWLDYAGLGRSVVKVS